MLRELTENLVVQVLRSQNCPPDFLIWPAAVGANTWVGQQTPLKAGLIDGGDSGPIETGIAILQKE